MSHRTRVARTRALQAAAVIGLVTLAAGCEVTSPSAVESDGRPDITSATLTGTVLRGPTTGVVVDGGAAGVPVSGARILLTRPGRSGAAATGLSGADGSYRVHVPAGTYVVTLSGAADYLFSKDLPATVAIADGQTVVLNVLLDTGIR